MRDYPILHLKQNKVNDMRDYPILHSKQNKVREHERLSNITLEAK